MGAPIIMSALIIMGAPIIMGAQIIMGAMGHTLELQHVALCCSGVQCCAVCCSGAPGIIGKTKNRLSHGCHGIFSRGVVRCIVW